MQITIKTRYLGDVTLDVEGEPKFKINGKETTLPTLMYSVGYGVKQSIDDAGADPKKGADGSKARLEALMKGEVPAGGGPRLSPMERAIRQVVTDRLRAAGVKAGQAAKLATEPEKAFRELIAAQVAKKLDIPMADVPKDTVERNFEKLWPTAILAKAQDIVEAAKPDEMSIEAV